MDARLHAVGITHAKKRGRNVKQYERESGPSGWRCDNAKRGRAAHRAMAFWHTMIGKKVVMAVTGVVLVGFVLGHMLGNLKIFSGPDEINAYSRFLREVGSPELAYGQLLWVVRVCPAHVRRPSHHRRIPAQPDELGCATGWI